MVRVPEQTVQVCLFSPGPAQLGCFVIVPLFHVWLAVSFLPHLVQLLVCWFEPEETQLP